MTSITVSSRALRTATLGPDGTLPLLGPLPETPYDPAAGAAAGLGDISYGYPPSLHPYTAQDGYGRSLEEREVTTVVLENELLRAVFLPDWGGRLWELFDKRSGKQLLHTPGTLQLANFALRNAWFAGGIEWNIGTRGHSPTTCAPLHHGIVRGPDGQDVLRFWEYERLRGVVFQVDAWLPEDSPVLFVSVRVGNTQDHDVPLYWWSNAAVPQTEGSRVIAPAATAYSSDYSSITVVNPSHYEGRDCTWPARNPHANDFFFDVPASTRKWVLNADDDGDGLVMLSTDRLRGRKLFVWGTGEGGRHWQRWLTPDGGEYAEIQAGLAQTQFQHLPLPAGASWSWTEAYGNAAVSPELAHVEDWAAAQAHCGERVDALLGRDALEEAHQAAEARMDLPVDEILGRGNGWGALEAVARDRAGLGAFPAGTPFPESSLGPEQEPWLALLRDGTFEGARTQPAGPLWDERLALVAGNSSAVLHRAFLAHGEGRHADARALYLEALGGEGLSTGETALAQRGLGLLAWGGQTAVGGAGAEAAREAVARYRTACALAPDDRRLLAEALEAILAAGQPEEGLALLSGVSFGNATEFFHGRLLLLKARALHALGRTDEVAELLKAGIEVPDLREGANVLRELWEAAVPGEPLPVRYDFTMS